MQAYLYRGRRAVMALVMVVGGAGGGLIICLHTALDDIPAEGLSGQISPSPIVILLGEMSTPLSLGIFFWSYTKKKCNPIEL